MCPEAVLAIRLTPTRSWPTQTARVIPMIPTHTTSVGLPKICLAFDWPTQMKIPRTAPGCLLVVVFVSVQCSATCDEGLRWRDVYCYDRGQLVSVKECDRLVAPPSSQSCNVQPCHQSR